MKISVVTPSYNQAHFLRRTMQSVLSQQGDFVLQWIVVDGGSTDGTVDLLKSVQDPRLTWSTGPDSGQSHAINKGFALATGDIVTWLNSDDLYEPGALAAVADAFGKNPSAHWLVGRCQIIDAEDRIIRRLVTRYKNHLLSRYSYPNLLRQNCISQPAVFWRSSFSQKIGGPDQSLHYTMDYDLWLRMAQHAHPLILNQNLARFRLHCDSKSGQVRREQFDEGYRVACRHAGRSPLSLLSHRLHKEKIVWSYRLMRLFKF